MSEINYFYIDIVLDILLLITLAMDYIEQRVKFKMGMDIESTSYHEAGHAVIDEYYTPGSIKRVVVYRKLSLLNYLLARGEFIRRILIAIKDKQSIKEVGIPFVEGYSYGKHKDYLGFIENLVTLRAGVAAEIMMGTVENTDSAYDNCEDMELITECIEKELKERKVEYDKLEESEEYISILKEVDKETRRILEEKKDLLCKIAEQLINNKTGIVKKKELRKIIGSMEEQR